MLLVIPLATGEGWRVLTYRNLPPHHVQFGAPGIEIRVRKSASPVIYPFREPVLSRRLRARGRVDGVLSVSAKEQGRKGRDDYALRLGLVEMGERRPGLLRRLTAPEWLKTLLDLTPPGTGVAQVRFFNVGVDPSQIGLRRRHPLSKLLHEEVVAAPDGEGRFEMMVQFDPPIAVTAVWINADGDDTGSSFLLTLDSLELDQ